MVAPRLLPRRSGLQRQVLLLYRDCLLAARKLPGDSRASATLFLRTEFRQGAVSVEKLDIQRIEHMIRQARKQVKICTMPGVSGFNFAKGSMLR